MAGCGGESILIRADCLGEDPHSDLSHGASQELHGVEAIKCSEHSMQPPSRGAGSPRVFVGL